LEPGRNLQASCLDFRSVRVQVGAVIPITQLLQRKSRRAGFEVKIPNACNMMDVKNASPFAMLTEEKVKFHFKP
jgi:hypothetical protein